MSSKEEFAIAFKAHEKKVAEQAARLKVLNDAAKFQLGGILGDIAKWAPEEAELIHGPDVSLPGFSTTQITIKFLGKVVSFEPVFDNDKYYLKVTDLFDRAYNFSWGGGQWTARDNRIDSYVVLNEKSFYQQMIRLIPS